MKPLATFFHLLRQAQEASQDVDHFDLHEHDPESKAIFKKLVDEQSATAMALVLHCTRNGPDLLKELGLADPPYEANTVSPEEVARIATNYLGDDLVQMALAGFLSKYLEANAGLKVDEPFLFHGIRLYLKAVSLSLGEAAALFNTGIWPP